MSTQFLEACFLLDCQHLNLYKLYSVTLTRQTWLYIVYLSPVRFITQEGHKLEVAPRPPMAVTNAVSWRSEGIKYRKNEVFLDVIESVNLLVSCSYIKK